MREKGITFFVLLFLLMFTTFLNNVPGLQVILRSTQLRDRSFAIGVHHAVARLVGSLPGPLIFGVLLAQACALSSSSSSPSSPSSPSGGEGGVGSEGGGGCGEETTCVLYDNASLARITFAFACTGKAVSCICFFVSWFLYKRETKGHYEAITPSLRTAEASSLAQSGADNGEEHA